MIRLIAFALVIFIIHTEVSDNTGAVKKIKSCFPYLKGWTRMSRFQKNEEWDTMRQARIEIEIFPKTEEKETTPTGLWNMHRQESGKFDEKKKA